MPKVAFEASTEWFERQRSSAPVVNQNLLLIETILRQLASDHHNKTGQALTLLAETLKSTRELHAAYMEPF